MTWKSRRAPLVTVTPTQQYMKLDGPWYIGNPNIYVAHLGSPVWIIQCFPRNLSSCCLHEADTCCGSGEYFTYNPETISAVLDEDGQDRLALEMTTTTTTTTVITTTTPGASSTSEPWATSTVSPTVIGLSAALGIVILFATFSLGFLWRKLQQAKAQQQQSEGLYMSMQYGPSQYGATQIGDHTIPELPETRHWSVSILGRGPTYVRRHVYAGNGRRIGLVVPCDYNEHLLQGNVSDLNQVIIVSIFKG